MRRSAPEWSAAWRVVEVIAIPVIWLLVRIQVIDAHKMPESGAVVVVSNHYSDFDPIVVGYATWRAGRVPRFLLKASILRIPVVGPILRRLGQVPVERSGRAGAADPLAAADALMEQGSAVIVYPEGTLTRDPDFWPMRGKTGAVRIALVTGAQVVPVAHWGAQRVLPRWSKSFRPFPRKTVRFVVGDPVDLSAWRGRPIDGPTMTAATAAVMEAITELVERLRGEEAPAERWDPAEHGQSEFGRP